jgi:hypothetical protein
MQVEPGDVDAVAVIRLQHRAAVDVDRDQARCRDLVVEHPVRIDQVVLGRRRNARADVVVGEIGHAVERDQPVARRKVDPARPLDVADAAAHVVDADGRGGAG